MLSNSTEAKINLKIEQTWKKIILQIFLGSYHIRDKNVFINWNIYIPDPKSDKLKAYKL